MGQFEYEYLIYEYPHIPKGDVEKDIQINTNKQIDKDDKTKISSFFVEEEDNIINNKFGYFKNATISNLN